MAINNLQDYKPEITFLIDRKGKIYYHNIDLYHDHEDLLIENSLNEKDVCRLIYDPNTQEAYLCGIPGIKASCNVLFDVLPFELKSIHLNSIENWIKSYDNIVEYSNTHKQKYKKDLDEKQTELDRANRIKQKIHEVILPNIERSYMASLDKWNKWKEEFPILENLDDQEEINKLMGITDKVQLKEHLDSCMERAEIKCKEDVTDIVWDFIKETVEEKEDSTETTKVYSYKRKLDLARFLEVSNDIIQKSEEPGAYYFTVGAELLYSILTKVADRACEIEDEPILNLLERLMIVERE